MTRLAALLLTVLTGFTGLVYQVAWQRYLATLLGSHSESTAAVLGIFLGGLSVGYWLFGAVTRRLADAAQETGRAPRLLLLYGALEAGIGVYALLFPRLFEGIQALSSWIPHAAAGAGFALDVALSALLIGPPAILMGATIPILTQALARSLSDATRFHAFIYAFNTAGAFAGALAAGFFLVPQLGLARVVTSMGAINLFAGAAFALLGLRTRALADLRGDEPPPGQVPDFAAYALVALLVGFSMMAVQTTAIRMAGLAFGSSQFTFSMVVSVFVLCIALGSFAVSALPRIRAAHLVANQWALALLLFALYPVFPRLPYWVHLLRTLFRDEEQAFYPYHLAGFGLMLALLGLPVALSGATLPLLFHDLRRRFGQLGSAAGNLYSWNTVGSLLGALLGGYALLFWLDLHQVYRLAVAALVVAAALLTLRIYRLPRAAALLALIPLMALSVAEPWNPWLLSGGLFRIRQAQEGSFAGFEAYRERVVKNRSGNDSRLLYYGDDPTATIRVSEHQNADGKPSVSIITNGKSDGDARSDYQTMGLAAILPAMLADSVQRAFVIGWGTGVSVGELADLPQVREVVVAEISPGVMAAAPFFDRFNRGASSNGKVRVVLSDAYRALLRSEGLFDVIVSEPSNPWVTGVEMLFSQDFLQRARERLSPGGVYAQWFHEYETDDASIELVLRTFASVFEHVAVWTTLDSDLLILGFRQKGPGIDHYRLEERASRPEFARALARCNVPGFPALLAHEALPLGVVHAAALQGPIHTLLHPRLSDVAGRAFYRGGRAHLPFTGYGAAAEVGARNSMLRAYAARFGGRIPEEERAQITQQACRYRPSRCLTLMAQWWRDDPDSPRLLAALETASKPDLPERVRELAELMGPDAEDGAPVDHARAREMSENYRKHYQHAAPFDPGALIGAWERCRVGVRSAEECEQAAARVRAGSVFVEEGALEDEIGRCQGARIVGRACEDGLAAARSLVRGPAPPSL